MLLVLVRITPLPKTDSPWSHGPEFLLPPNLKAPGRVKMQQQGKQGTAVVRLLKLCGKAAGSLEVGNGGRIKELHKELHM